MPPRPSSSLYTDLAAAYVRGMLPGRAGGRSANELIDLGREAGLELQRFKRTMELPRVRAVLGILRGLAPVRLLDIGTGRGVFLWPLLDTFPELEVTVVERDERRLQHLTAVGRGGIDRLRVVAGDAAELPFADRAFDVVTTLEVLEHQTDPLPMAREALRVAGRFLIVSVPSKPDENPEHVQLFSAASLTGLLAAAGAAKVQVEPVLNHMIAIARKQTP